MGISHMPVASKALTRASLIPPATIASKSRVIIHTQNGQTRTFKIGLWSAWEDQSSEKESRRRHRIAKEKYIASFNKRLCWDRYFPTPQRHVGLKSFMCSSWRAEEGKSGQHWYVDENGNIKSRNATETGKPNEDIEHDSSNRLWRYENRKSIFGNSRSGPFGSPWTTSFTTETYSQSPRNSSASSSEDSTTKTGYSTAQDSYYEVDSEIDPITNRRVVKNPSNRPKNSTKESTNIPVKAFKGYQSQFQSFSPPKTESSQTSAAVEEGLKAYDGKVDYKAHKLYDPAETKIDYSDPVEGGLKAFDEKLATKPLESDTILENQSTEQHDPKGILKERQKLEADLDPVEEAIQEYETHEEHPEISQQVRDQHLQARWNARRGSERQTSVDGQHPQPQHADALFESIQEYSTSPPKVESQSTTSNPIQEGLEAYDNNKADYEPKHLVDLPVKHTDFPGRAETEGSDWAGGSSTRESLVGRTRKDLEAEFEQESRLSPSEEAEMVEKVKNTPKLIQELKVETSELRNHVAHARSRIDAKIAEVEAGWETPKDTQKMTGNFVRDFPEEFENSWSQSESGSGSLTPKTRSERQIESDIQNEERSYVEGLASKEAFARDPNTPRLETALDRTGSGNSNQEDASNALLKKQNDKNLVREVRKVYEDAYGTIDTKHRQINGSTGTTESTEVDTPTLYKILAYDPTMQSMSIAETASIVSDSSNPLTPAEVLLRLSNPAKFFPHFQPLQSQGFEIVSGSGDVLVFRKVRSGSPLAIKTEENSATESRRRTNPIDGMSVPIAATGDFASPTGFVNHDINRGSNPPFKSNIDVRREEPVFSGKKKWEEDNEVRKPRSTGKRIFIGAASVAAFSYAVGVVADFFKTGGLDGLGPQGF